MCKAGNGSIFLGCRDEIFRRNGTPHVSNQEMRRILKEHKGCMQALALSGRGLDKNLAFVLTSSQ